VQHEQIKKESEYEKKPEENYHASPAYEPRPRQMYSESYQKDSYAPRPYYKKRGDYYHHKEDHYGDHYGEHSYEESKYKKMEPPQSSYSNSGNSWRHSTAAGDPPITQEHHHGEEVQILKPMTAAQAALSEAPAPAPPPPAKPQPPSKASYAAPIYFPKQTSEEPQMASITSFDELGLKEELLRGIYGYGFTHPSPIQQKAILPLLQGKDTIAQVLIN
jgi:hypothetical protein